MQRLPDGGRGLVAFNIGARIRFFGSALRNALFSDVSDNDTRIVAQCMLMNYEDLTSEEKLILWEMIPAHASKPGNGHHGFALH